MTPTPVTPFLLDFGHDDPLKIELSLPRTEVTVHEILPAMFAVADAVHARSIQQVEAMGKTIGCGPNCGECCKQLVPISEYEAAHLAGVVRAMPAQQRSRIVMRFTHAIQKLDEAGLMGPLNETFARDIKNNEKILDLKKQYWDLQIPCPFLEDGSCSIHGQRPLVCRQYLVTSAPKHCLDIYTDKEAHEIVLHTVDVGGTLAAFSGAGLQDSRIVPHIFSLLAERAIRSKPMPMLPAEQMMGRYLNLLAECFTRTS